MRISIPPITIAPKLLDSTWDIPRLFLVGVFVVTCGLSGSAVAQTQYSVTTIKVPAGVYLTDVNSAGQVAGGSLGLTFYTGDASGLKPIPLPPGWTGSSYLPVSINESGQVAGTAHQGSAWQAFIGTASGSELVALVPGGAQYAIAYAVNTSGEVTGEIRGGQAFEAFIGTPAGSVAIPAPPGTVTAIGAAINASGEVAGVYFPHTGLLGGLPFVGTVASFSPFQPPSGFSAALAAGINDSGQVAGYVSNSYSSGSDRAFTTTSSGSTVIPLPPTPPWATPGSAGQNYFGNVFFDGCRFTGGHNLNNSGVVVGNWTSFSSVCSPPAHSEGWIWDSVNGLRVLSTLVASPWNVIDAISIANSGIILAYGSCNGTGCPNSGKYTGYILLTPSGIDLSQIPFDQRLPAIIKKYAPQFVIASAWSGKHVWPAQANLSTFPSSTIPKGTYAYIDFYQNAPVPSGWDQIQSAIKELGNQLGSVGFLAVDVECTTPGHPGNHCVDWAGESSSGGKIALNNQNIYQAIQAAEAANLKPLVYTEKNAWHVMTAGGGDSTGTISFGCIPLWQVRADGVASLSPSGDAKSKFDVKLPFGGWSQRIGKQYKEEQPASPITVDLDVFDSSVFSPPDNPEAPRSCANSPTECMALDATLDQMVTAKFSKYAYNPNTDLLDQNVTITNLTNTAISGPWSVVFDGLTPNAQPLEPATGLPTTSKTSCTYPNGSFYIEVSESQLGPKQSMTIPMEFKWNPKSGAVVYTPRLLVGPATR